MPGAAWSPCQKRCTTRFSSVATQDYVDDLAQRVEHNVASAAAQHACGAALLAAEEFESESSRSLVKTMVVPSSNKAQAVTMAKLRVAVTVVRKWKVGARSGR